MCVWVCMKSWGLWNVSKLQLNSIFNESIVQDRSKGYSQRERKPRELLPADLFKGTAKEVLQIERGMAAEGNLEFQERRKSNRKGK